MNRIVELRKNVYKTTDEAKPAYLKAEMVARISQDKDIGWPNSSLKKNRMAVLFRL